MSDHTLNGAAVRGRQPVVLQVLPRLEAGGVERGTIEVAAALAEAGWTPLVASAGGPMVYELKRLGVPHVELPLASKNPVVMRRNVRRLVRLIREYDVDIVHARSRAPAWSARAAARRTGRHFVTTYHGTYRGGLLGLKTLYNSVMARGERVIAISHFIAEHIQQVHGVEADRIRVIHRGVDLDRFDPALVTAQRQIQLARQWRLPEDAPVVMLPGRLARWKGQAVLIEAMALLGRHDIRCLLVGAPQRERYRQELLALAEKRGLADVVHIVDHCNDMAAAYKLTDVVVNASTEPEAFGRVVVEAQAMGRPVVATDHGGPRETVVHGVTGWLAKPGDAVSLAAALDRALSLTPEEREAVAHAGMENVRRHFDRRAMTDATLAVYEEVLAAGDEAEPALGAVP